MIEKIKENLSKLVDKNIKIVVDIGRNKIETYEGKITKLYDNVWIFKTNNFIKSFSYKDILIKMVKIEPK